MDYNWPLFDGAHVLIRPKRMTEDQLQEGYYYFLRQAYSLGCIRRRFRGGEWELPAFLSHFTRNYLLSRYGMLKTAHAIRRKTSRPVEAPESPAVAPHAPLPGDVPLRPLAVPRRQEPA